MNDSDTVLPGKSVKFFQVFHADRLPAGHVHGRVQAHVGDLVGTLLGDQALEHGEIALLSGPQQLVHRRLGRAERQRGVA